LAFGELDRVRTGLARRFRSACNRDLSLIPCLPELARAIKRLDECSGQVDLGP